jgi:hypothetical protein
MHKITLITLLFHSILSYSQSMDQKIPWVQKKGIIYFEKSQAVYSMYFIETPYTDLKSLLQAKDTVVLYSLGSPGDASDDKGYKSYLDKTTRFQIISLLINAENHLGQYYEETITAYSKNGYIKYVEGLQYDLAPTSRKVMFNNKEVIFVTRKFIKIDSFINIKHSVKKGKN